MATDRTANVVWQGDLMNGGGTIESVTSGAFAPLDVSWASRSEDPNGKTSALCGPGQGRPRTRQAGDRGDGDLPAG